MKKMRGKKLLVPNLPSEMKLEIINFCDLLGNNNNFYVEKEDGRVYIQILDDFGGGEVAQKEYFKLLYGRLDGNVFLLVKNGIVVTFIHPLRISKFVPFGTESIIVKAFEEREREYEIQDLLEGFDGVTKSLRNISLDGFNPSDAGVLIGQKYVPRVSVKPEDKSTKINSDDALILSKLDTLLVENEVIFGDDKVMENLLGGKSVLRVLKLNDVKFGGNKFPKNLTVETLSVVRPPVKFVCSLKNLKFLETKEILQSDLLTILKSCTKINKLVFSCDCINERHPEIKSYMKFQNTSVTDVTYLIRTGKGKFLKDFLERFQSIKKLTLRTTLKKGMGSFRILAYIKNGAKINEFTKLQGSVLKSFSKEFCQRIENLSLVLPANKLTEKEVENFTNLSSLELTCLNFKSIFMKLLRNNKKLKCFETQNLLTGDHVNNLQENGREISTSYGLKKFLRRKFVVDFFFPLSLLTISLTKV